MYLANIKEYKLNCFVIFIFILFSFFLLTKTTIAAEGDCNAGNQYCKYGLGSNLEGVPTPLQANPDIPSAAGRVIGAGLSFIGVLFFILMIYGGILWMTAHGNDQQVGKAKDLITAAIIGMIIVLSAYAITAFIGTELTAPPAG